VLTKLKRYLLRFGIVQDLREAKRMRHTRPYGEVRLKYPDGHFYSPIPDLAEIRAREDDIFTVPDELSGIDLRKRSQLELAAQLARFYEEQPFKHEKRSGRRYHFKNIYFSYGDALMLYGMLRHLEPARLIEVGSGYSSAATLDVNDRFLEGRLECTFIEPYPQRLHKLLRGTDGQRHEVIEAPLQQVDLGVFDRLQDGDVLFIDSTHVSKIGSDVNRILFEVLPRLRSGVVIHIHDIFFPFEYPRSWVYEGRAWNEAYLLRAFLTDNPQFEILLWNSYLAEHHAEEVKALMPLWGRNPGGSIWLRRT
jgi:hypothetical protein